MIAFEVSLNEKRICVAGAEDLGVLSAHVTACGKLGKKTVPFRPDDASDEIHYSVGGLTSRPKSQTNVHVRWASDRQLRVGDVVTVRVIETETADRATSRSKVKRALRRS